MFPKKLPEPPQLKEHPPSLDSSEGEDDIVPIHSKTRNTRSSSGQLSSRSKHGLHSPAGSTHSFDLQVSYSYIFLSAAILTASKLIIWNGYSNCSVFQKVKKKHNKE